MADQAEFRVANTTDAELLLDFMQEYYAFDGHGYDRDKARVALIPLLQSQSLGCVWIILDGESPVGYAVICFGYSLEWLGRDAFIDEIYLRENYRGRGWGRQAMGFLEDAAREFGVRALHLGVVAGNPALHLYERVGFRKHESTFLSKWIARSLSKPPAHEPGNRNPRPR